MKKLSRNPCCNGLLILTNDRKAKKYSKYLVAILVVMDC